VNITLSADATLIEKARDFARDHGTTLNGMVRDYMRSVVGEQDRDAAADEFARLAMESAGTSEAGLRFDREAAHERGNS